ncbi:hypothetical protein DFS33DRAFT_1274005 [Desarmillaria ectypa]|nr:hypothetical protein DFS33DRAFT_1274005 [Desarmillaria ectypa]
MNYSYPPEIRIHSPSESDGPAFKVFLIYTRTFGTKESQEVMILNIYLTSSAGDEGMLFDDGTSPYEYSYYLTPSNSLSPVSPSIPLLTPEDTQYSLPQYSPVQFQGSALLANSFQSLHISDYSQPSSPTSSINQPHAYFLPTASNFQNTLPAEYDNFCLLSPISTTESVALSPSPTTSVSSLPDEEQNTGRGHDFLGGKRCTLPANAKRNLRSPPERSAVAQHRKKINTAKKEHAANGSEAKRIREQKYKCQHDGCTKTYTASHNFKDHLMWHQGKRLLCPHRDSGCREDYAQEVSLCRHHSHSHKDCTEHHRRADYVWAIKEECP